MKLNTNRIYNDYEYYINNSNFARGSMKRRLLKDKYLVEKCYICGLGNLWNGKPLVHVLDHINGDSKDNRLSNLRLVCPNCDSQLDTFTGRNIKKESNSLKIRNKNNSKSRKINKVKCIKCESFVNENSKSGLCVTCFNKSKRKVKNRPSIIELKNMIDSGLSLEKIGQIYGVTGNAVKKWLR